MTLTSDQTRIPSGNLIDLEKYVRELYDANALKVPFHGWDHTNYVRNKALDFAAELEAEEDLVEAAALVHDLNHVVSPGSSVDEGSAQRREVLARAGFTVEHQDHIEVAIHDAHTSNRSDAYMSARGVPISAEAKALSDADTLFKVEPATLFLFSHKYPIETGISVRAMADKILGEQCPLIDGGVYFYSQTAKQLFAETARVNIDFWKILRSRLDDPDVVELIHSRGIDAGV